MGLLDLFSSSSVSDSCIVVFSNSWLSLTAVVRTKIAVIILLYVYNYVLSYLCSSLYWPFVCWLNIYIILATWKHFNTIMIVLFRFLFHWCSYFGKYKVIQWTLINPNSLKSSLSIPGSIVIIILEYFVIECILGSINDLIQTNSLIWTFKYLAYAVQIITC